MTRRILAKMYIIVSILVWYCGTVLIQSPVNICIKFLNFEIATGNFNDTFINLSQMDKMNPERTHLLKVKDHSIMETISTSKQMLTCFVSASYRECVDIQAIMELYDPTSPNLDGDFKALILVQKVGFLQF